MAPFCSATMGFARKEKTLLLSISKGRRIQIVLNKQAWSLCRQKNEVILKKRPERAKAQCVFELFPESFDDGNGAGLADGAESVPDTESEEKPLKSGVDKLAPLVRYKVSGDSETSYGFEKKNSDV